MVQEVLEDQAERHARRETAAEKQKRKRLLPLPVVALLWAAVCLIVWAFTPAFLLPEPLPDPTPAQVETGLRMEMFGLVVQIDRYRQENGRIPGALAEAAEDPPADIVYVPSPPSSYRLRGQRGGAELVYESGEPLEGLVEEARRRMESGGEGGP